jgi:hypothetical protein
MLPVSRAGFPSLPNHIRQATCPADETGYKPALQSERAIDARYDFLFAEHFEQVIQARTYITASYSEACGMNDRANF